MYYKKFAEDFKQGKFGEGVVADYLIYKNSNWSFMHENNDKLYDFMLMTDVWVNTYEVKTDMYEYYYKRTTNNMILETMCRGKLSGVSATTAIPRVIDLTVFQIIPR